MELLACALTCQRFWALQDGSDETSELIWKPLCLRHLAKFRYNTSRLDIYERVRSDIPIKVVKSLLVENKLSAAARRCVEIDEYRRLFVAMLLFGNRSLTNGDNSRNGGRGGGLLRGFSCNRSLPDWSTRMRPYKATYFFNLRDFRRNSISRAELCACVWSFAFKPHMYEEYVPENEFLTKCHFTNDGRYFSQMFDRVFPYRVVDEDHMGYIKTLQVAQFPLISCCRLVNGLFRFENSNVTLTQYMENNFENDVEAVNAPLLLNARLDNFKYQQPDGNDGPTYD